MEINFKRNAWHRKFQKWVWKDATPDFFSLCPYFWFTIFTILITFVIPIVPIIKLIVLLFDSIDKYIVEPNYEKWLESLEYADAGVLRWGEGKLSARKPFAFYSKRFLYSRWLDKMLAKGKTEDELNNLIYKASEEQRTKNWELYNKQETDKALKEKAKLVTKAKVQRFMSPIVLWTTRLTYLVLTVFGMALITLFLNFLIMHITLGGTLLVLKYTALIILVGLVLTVIIMYAYNSIKDRIDNNESIAVFQPFIFIGNIFKWLWFRLVDLLDLFLQYFKSTKNNYCPAINWDDEEND